MPRKPVAAEPSTPAYPYATLDDYLAEVRKLLLAKALRPEWVDELISSDALYLESRFAHRELPVFGAFELYITEDESAREPVKADHRLKLDVSEQGRLHLRRLVELGLWGASEEEVAKRLVEQALAAKLESGVLQATSRR